MSAAGSVFSTGEVRRVVILSHHASVIDTHAVRPLGVHGGNPLLRMGVEDALNGEPDIEIVPAPEEGAALLPAGAIPPDVALVDVADVQLHQCLCR